MKADALKRKNRLSKRECELVDLIGSLKFSDSMILWNKDKEKRQVSTTFLVVWMGSSYTLSHNIPQRSSQKKVFLNTLADAKMEFLRGVCQKDHDKNRVRLQAFQNPKSMLSPLHPTATHKDITNGWWWGKEENHLIDLTFPKINVQGVLKNNPLLFH